MKISDIDKNLKVPETVKRDDIRWLSAKESCFRLYGACCDTPYRRLPEDVAAAANSGILALSTNTAGIRLRFRTDSPYVAIHAEWDHQTCFSHMPLTGVCGFDLYCVRNGRYKYAGTYTPPFVSKNGYESVVNTPGGMQDFVLDFPLYNNVSTLYVGVSSAAKFEDPAGYKYEKPVIYYGSSITQGGCASRPGNSYQGMLTRALDADHVNLGFSGSARGELSVAKFIGESPMSVFVYDYDHNAPSAEHLQATHYNFYKAVRDMRPDVPIVMLSMPEAELSINPDLVAQWLARRDIVKATFDKAKSEGDKNVYFIDGCSLFNGDELGVCTVDGAHPNDYGFHRFYEVLYPLLYKLLEETQNNNSHSQS